MTSKCHAWHLEIITFYVITLCGRKVITFCVENFIIFCVNVITICSDSNYILRPNSGIKIQSEKFDWMNFTPAYCAWSSEDVISKYSIGNVSESLFNLDNIVAIW